MAKLCKFTSTGDVRLISTEEWENDIIVVWSLGISFSLITTDKGRKTVRFLSREYLEAQRKLNEEMVINGKEVKEIISDKTYNDFIRTDDCRSYQASEFDRYEENCICPETETRWLSIKFMENMTKLFDIAIRYYFTDGHIVGRSMDDDKFLFITGWVAMHKQLSLISPEA